MPTRVTQACAQDERWDICVHDGGNESLVVVQVVMVNDARLSERLGGLEVVVVVSERHLDSYVEVPKVVKVR